jgi:glycosyltransferase involved in cell wall biosynthesis
VHFPGYVTGLRKRAFFALASLYVFPSRHESYGLTLLEALRAGLPAVCLDHDGARSVMRPEFGELVEPKELRPAISQLLSDAEALSRMSLMARSYAESQPFSASAASLADLLRNL